MAYHGSSASHGSDSRNLDVSDPFSHYSLYITLQYLRTIHEVNKYHRALYLTENETPKGFLVHATDTGRSALDLYKEIRAVKNPLRSKSLITVFKIGGNISLQSLDACASSVPLMDPRYLPRGEVQWTCRVWVKEALRALQEAGLLSLPCSLNSLENYCLRHTDNYLPKAKEEQRAKVYDNVEWAVTSDSNPDVTGNNSQTATQGGDRYYGPSPMIIDSTGGQDYASSTSTRYYSPSPMHVDAAATSQYYGPSPMDTETSRR
ncbi:hypothetical protein F5Y01DRAFT_320766 [Xylaria sp. FL0043]|nr:hypothetical protein F5Y01DRAFT_320766 [Xylaria sp. FL0043]